MTCNPCQISVIPERIGFATQYAGCLSRYNGLVVDFKPAGITVNPEPVGINVQACKIPIAPPSEVLTPELLVEGITADDQTSEIEVTFTEELDPACDWETGVTITVDGVPVNILSVTPSGSTDPWPYIYEVDVTLGFNETIVWNFDAAVGEICALSGTKLGDTTETTTTPIPATPPIPGYSIWLNPDTFTLTGTTIEGWDNDATASRGAQANMTSAGSAIDDSSYNSFRVARAGSATKWLQSDTKFVIPHPFSIFVVGQFETDNSQASLTDFHSLPGNRILVQKIGNDYSIEGTPGVGIVTQVDGTGDNDPHLFACRFETLLNRGRISGFPDGWEDNPDASNQIWSYGSVLNRVFNPTVQALGWVGEVLVYENVSPPNTLSNAQLQTVYDWMIAKWNLTA